MVSERKDKMNGKGAWIYMRRTALTLAEALVLAVVMLCLCAPYALADEEEPSASSSGFSHIVMLDVSGSMRNTSGLDNRYGSIQGGFDKSVVKFMKGLFTPKEGYIGSSDPVTLMPIMFYGEAEELAAKRQPEADRRPVSGLTVSNFAETLEDGKKFPGPGAGGYGKGLEGELFRGLDAGKGKRCIYWLLTDNGQGGQNGQNREENPYAFYKQLRRPSLVDYVWFVPVGTLDNKEGRLVLYVIVTGGSFSDDPREAAEKERKFLKGLRSALASAAKSVSKESSDLKVVKFFPLYDDQGSWVFATDSYSSGGSALDSGLRVYMQESEDRPGEWKGEVRCSASSDLDSSWKFDFSKAEIDDDAECCEIAGNAGNCSVGGSVAVLGESEDGGDIPVTWTIKLSSSDAALVKSFHDKGASVKVNLSASGRIPAPNVDVGNFADHGVAHLNKIREFASKEGSGGREGTFKLDGIEGVNLVIKPQPRNIWPYVGIGIAAAALGYFAFSLLRSGKRYKIDWIIKTGDDERKEGSTEFFLRTLSRSEAVFVDDYDFGEFCRSENSLKFVSSVPEEKRLSAAGTESGCECSALCFGKKYTDFVFDDVDNKVYEVVWSINPCD